MNSNPTRDLILDSAQALAQARGFNGFSYADIAAEVGIRKASIHHHFPTKHALETELLERYRATFIAELNSIESSVSGSVERLQRYAQLYTNTLSNHCICLAGMMASDVGALPEQLKPSLEGFFREHMEWLTKVLAAGKSAGELNFDGSAPAQASAFLAALQGGLLMANAMGDDAVFKKLKQTLVSQLKS
ncbi:TetR/AcrR family transcriptional regulator [Granulosicoccus sp. 3-233]|uniref:TetR/AcrR family transcriptional regulator n=1 Tax=Granulosicoccus sp. 3-233 TaxID=3417969 RepID=UPI003D34CC22